VLIRSGVSWFTPLLVSVHAFRQPRGRGLEEVFLKVMGLLCSRSWLAIASRILQSGAFS